MHSQGRAKTPNLLFGAVFLEIDPLQNFQACGIDRRHIQQPLLSEAIRLVEEANTEDYEGKFIIPRELVFLREAEKLLSQKQVWAIGDQREMIPIENLLQNISF